MKIYINDKQRLRTIYLLVFVILIFITFLLIKIIFSPAYIIIRSDNNKFHITVNGETKESLTNTPIKIKSGYNNIKITAEDAADYSEKLYIGPEKTKEILLELKPITDDSEIEELRLRSGDN